MEFTKLLATCHSIEHIMTLTRQLLLIYQPSKDNTLLDQYISLLLSPTTTYFNTLIHIKDKDLHDTWVWLICLLIKKVLLPSIVQR
jgi:hypothetical protein